MTYPLVGDLAAQGVPVRLTRGLLSHSTQAYCVWVKRRVSRRNLDDVYLTNGFIDAHGDDSEFSLRLLSDELARLGQTIGARRVWRLRSQHKLWSATERKCRSGSGKTPGRPSTATMYSATSLQDARTRGGSSAPAVLAHRPGQARLLSDQGLVQQPDSGPRSRRADDRAARRGGPAGSGRSALARERGHRPL